MPHHGEGPYVTGDYTSAEITERMLRRKINRLEKEKAELEMYLNSLPAKHRIDRLERENAELVEALEGLYSHTKNNHIIHGLNAKAKAVLANQPQPCGHPRSAIVNSDEGTCCCGECEKEVSGSSRKWSYD
jgi:hypothetical protein